MTISSTTVKNSYSGDGSTSAFSYTFKIFANSDLQVIIRSSTGAETVKTITTHYTVSGAGDANGGSVTFTSGNIPASGETVVIEELSRKHSRLIISQMIHSLRRVMKRVWIAL